MISKELSGVIAQMLKPLKGLSLNIVIERLSGHKVIPFDKNNSEDQKILDTLIKCAKNVKVKVNKNEITRDRPNEIGNDIESFVKEELKNLNSEANTLIASNGNKKSTGYPDIAFKDHNQNINYLECKTLSIKNINTT